MRSFSGTFDLILFEAVSIEFIVERVWLDLDSQLGRTDKTNVFWFALFEFGLIWFGYFSVKQTN